jgi:hypothetical protein
MSQSDTLIILAWVTIYHLSLLVSIGLLLVVVVVQYIKIRCLNKTINNQETVKNVVPKT